MIRITLSTAHKMKTLSDTGMTHRAIGEKLGFSHVAVGNILRGKGLIKQRAIADRMETFLGGVIRGSGNTRFHAASPKDENDDGHTATVAHHPFDVPYEDGQIVPKAPDVLTLLLAEEDLITRLQDAGIDPDEVLVIDHTADTDESVPVGGKREHRSRPEHETWEEWVQRAKDDGIIPAEADANDPDILHKNFKLNKRLENEANDR